MRSIEDREFEPVVREAMRARPAPGSISNLAYRAMERAREQARMIARRQLEGLMRLRRRARWVGAVGAVLIAVVVLVGAKKVAESGVFGTTALASASSESGTSDSTSTTSSTDTMTIVTAELLVVMLILLSVGVAFYRPEGGETVYY